MKSFTSTKASLWHNLTLALTPTRVSASPKGRSSRNAARACAILCAIIALVKIAAKTPKVVQQWRNALMRQRLDALLGDGSDLALQQVTDIAMGKISAFPTPEQMAQISAMPERMRKMYIASFTPPSWSERLQAWALLLAYHQGKPSQVIEITAEVADPAPPVDYSKLSDEELQRLHSLLEKASTSADRVVEGVAHRLSEVVDAVEVSNDVEKGEL